MFKSIINNIFKNNNNNNNNNSKNNYMSEQTFRQSRFIEEDLINRIKLALIKNNLLPPILDFISTITTDVLLSDLIFIKLYYGYHLAFQLSTILLHRERWLSTSARGDARVALKFPTQHLPLDHDYSLSSKIPSLSS